MPSTITVRRAEAHEALTLKLSSLARLAAGIAGRNPLAPVPREVRARAEGLLFDGRPFGVGNAVRSHRPFEPAAPTYGGLSAQLSEALARLEAFEARHTLWDARLKCVCWRVHGAPLPVQRLHPEPLPQPDKPRRTNTELDALRRKIAERIEQLYSDNPG